MLERADQKGALLSMHPLCRCLSQSSTNDGCPMHMWIHSFIHVGKVYTSGSYLHLQALFICTRKCLLSHIHLQLQLGYLCDACNHYNARARVQWSREFRLCALSSSESLLHTDSRTSLYKFHLTFKKAAIICIENQALVIKLSSFFQTASHVLVSIHLGKVEPSRMKTLL